MNLQLPLTTKWFELTKSCVKTEDYRDVSSYWFKRLCTGINNHNSKNNDAFYVLLNYLGSKRIDEVNKQLKFKPFIFNVMTLGYPKATDSSRILKLEHNGIEIRTGNPDWGAVPGRYYFVIKHGVVV